MSGTREGGLKCAATNKLKHGDDFYKRIGAKGGKVKNPNKGFGSNHERAVAAGYKGYNQKTKSKNKYKLQTRNVILKHNLG